MWWELIIDSYVLSMGVGVVGTDRSTMSLLAEKRVRDWRGGSVRTVRWGGKDADAHRTRRALSEMLEPDWTGV